MINTELSHWWRYGVVAVAVGGLTGLLWIATNTCSGDVGTPIPAQVIDVGKIIFTDADIIIGQHHFKHALTKNNSL